MAYMYIFSIIIIIFAFSLTFSILTLCPLYLSRFLRRNTRPQRFEGDSTMLFFQASCAPKKFSRQEFSSFHISPFFIVSHFFEHTF